MNQVIAAALMWLQRDLSGWWASGSAQSPLLQHIWAGAHLDGLG